jgi:response regulator RpfG family c-di-GMP phosphodiesterase
LALQKEHTLLLVDDEKAITRALHRLFRKEGYHILTAESGLIGLEKLHQLEEPVSMIISDQRMPEMNGAKFLEKSKAICPEAIRYLLTGYSDLDAVIQAVNKGEIHRYLTKPWNDNDLLLQVAQSLEHYELVSENKRLTALTAAQNAKLNDLNKNLEGKVKERTSQVIAQNQALEKINRMLEASFMDSIRLLTALVEIIKPALGKQMRQVAQLSRKVAEEFHLSATELDKIEMAGMIHDIGLLGLPDELQSKDVKQMSDEQYRLFSEHPVIGSVILDSVDKLAGVGELVLFHHEYVNGQGFPNGLRKSQIPLGSRIILAVSDYLGIMSTWPRDARKLVRYTRRHFDASVWKSFTVTDDPEVTIEEAAEKKLLIESNRKYDADVVTALIKVIRKSKNIDPSYVVSLKEIEAGMVLMEDLRLSDGRLLLTKGTKLKETTTQTIQSIGERGMLPEKLLVSIPEGNETMEKTK